MSVVPFQIDITEENVLDLRSRLANTRWPRLPADTGWKEGTNESFLRKVVDYWRDQYNWFEHQAELNKFEHYLADLRDGPVHFIHARGKGPRPMPILIGHGCFSNFVELTKIIGPLSDPAAYGGDPADSFDVVAWSIPGFGFSFVPEVVGFDIPRVSEVAHELMSEALGYTRYATLGGSWSAQVAIRLAEAHKSSIIGQFLTQAAPPSAPSRLPDATRSPAEDEYLRRSDDYRREGVGYVAQLTTRPQSLAYAVNDSPAGLAGWVLEKLRVWSDCDGELLNSFSLDELLTSLSVTWFTQTVGSGQRMYYEMAHSSWKLEPSYYSDIPTAVLGLPGGIPQEAIPSETISRNFNLQYYQKAPKGGHYPAWEVPQTVVEHVRAFFRGRRNPN